jgi:glycosyltransferase involved in cell wall biosynthesis
VRVHFVNQPWASALPPSESVARWTNEVARQLAAEHEVVVWASRGRHEPATVVEGNVTYRFVVGNGDYRLLQLLRATRALRTRRRPMFASPLYRLAYYLAIARRLRAERPDVVHIHNFSQAVPLVRRACPTATVVLHMHTPWLAQLDRRRIARRLAHADLIIGCSEFITAAGRNAFPTLSGRFHTVYNGFDPSVFAVATERRSDREDRVQLLYFGRISPEKGLHDLITAFNRAARDLPSLRLVIVGKEAIPEADMLLNLEPQETYDLLRPFWRPGYLDASRRRLSPDLADRVVFEPWLDHDGLATRLAESAAVVVPSVGPEAFPMPAVEALGAGVPVIGTRVGGLPELVRDRDNGLLVDPSAPEQLADALHSFASDAALRTRLFEHAAVSADDFAWKTLAERTLSLYRRGAHRVDDTAGPVRSRLVRLFR